MIDRIVLNKDIELDISKFDTNKFKKRKYYVNADNNEDDTKVEKIIYISNSDGVCITYNPQSNMLKVSGRLINYFSTNNLVVTLGTAKEGSLFSETTIAEEEYTPQTYCYEYDIDDNLIPVDENFKPIVTEYNTIMTEQVWEENLNTIIYDVNHRIFDLTGIRLDIRNFKVVQLDACFNIPTEHYNEYLIIFNEIFRFEDLNKRYTNFAIHNDKPLYSSFYVKTNATYRDNSNTNYTVNFYNKIDQLINRRYSTKYNQKISDEDLSHAHNILRLEVKAGYHFLNKFCSDNGICTKQRPFKDFLDIDVCAKIIEIMYMRFIDKTGNLDFYSYKSAKEKIIGAGLKNEKDVLKFLQGIAQGHKNSIKDRRTLNKYKDILSDLGIHYFLIPKNLQLDYLPSPICILKQQIEITKEMSYFFNKVVLNGEKFDRNEYSASTINKLSAIYKLDSIQ